MRTMVMLVGCILLLPTVQADGRDGPDERVKALVEEMLDYLGEEGDEIVDEVLGILDNAAACFGSSVPMSDVYVDQAYHEEPVNSDGSTGGSFVSVRTNPQGTGATGVVVVVAVGSTCSNFYHNGDEAFVVGGG